MFEDIEYNSTFRTFRLRAGNVVYSSEIFNPHIVFVYTYIPYLAASKIKDNFTINTSLPSKNQIALYKLKHVTKTYNFRFEGFVDALLCGVNQCEVIANTNKPK